VNKVGKNISKKGIFFPFIYLFFDIIALNLRRTSVSSMSSVDECSNYIKSQRLVVKEKTNEDIEKNIEVE